MAGTIPFSNPAGNNQTSPGAGMPKATGGPAMPVVNPTNTTQNPFVPAGSPVKVQNGAASLSSPGAVPSSPGAGSVPNVGGLVNDPSNKAGTTGGLDKQLVDIYGKGVGGALSDLLKNMSGTDSKVLQDYIASLQPQMAKAQANTNAALGAGGVSANSSVAAIADSNLQAQETAAIAGESANLIQSQEQLTASILMGTSPAASKEVSASGWQVFGNVLENIASDAATAASHMPVG